MTLELEYLIYLLEKIEKNAADSESAALVREHLNFLTLRNGGNMQDSKQVEQVQTQMEAL